MQLSDEDIKLMTQSEELRSLIQTARSGDEFHQRQVLALGALMLRDKIPYQRTLADYLASWLEDERNFPFDLAK